jgi:site-specific recombinase XerD
MKTLQAHLAEYIAARRALGTRLQEPAQTLRHFIKFLARNRSVHITTSLALEWSQQSKHVQRATWARKLSMVRQFARWVHALDPQHQIPPPRLLGIRHRRNPPHIYSDEEIAALMAEAAKCDSDKGMRSLNLETIIGLLAATGLRPGEAFALQRKDVDLQAGILMIRESKFGKSRQVPIHPSTVMALKHYVRRRDQLFCHHGETGFSSRIMALPWMPKLSAGGFAKSQGTAVCGKKVRAIDVAEVRVFKTCGIPSPPSGWWNGIKPGRMSRFSCRSFQPIWDTHR